MYLCYFELTAATRNRKWFQSSTTTQIMSSETESTNTPTWTKPPFGGLAWVEIPATDVLRAKAFYSTVFGLEFYPPRGGYPIDKLAVFYFSGRAVMGGIRKVDAEEAGKLGLGSRSSGMVNYLLVDDIDEAFKKIKEAGGAVHTPKIEEGGHTILGRFVDTEGNIVGILQWLPMPQ